MERKNKKFKNPYFAKIILPILVATLLVIVFQFFLVRTYTESTLNEQITKARTIIDIMEKLYKSTYETWDNERHISAQLEGEIIAEVIKTIYQLTEDKDITRNVSIQIADFIYYISPFQYIYIVNLETGYLVAHPMENVTVSPPSILEKIRGACPKGVISYTWTVPYSTTPTTKHAYVECISDLDWAVGVSIYKKDIESTMASIKDEIKEIINDLVKPNDAFIEMKTFTTLPSRYEKNNTHKSATVYSKITGLFYVYSIKENVIITSVIKLSLPFIAIFTILAIVIYWQLNREWDTRLQLEKIWEEISNVTHSSSVNTESLIELIAKRINKITNALAVKQFTGEIISLISTSDNLHEALHYIHAYLAEPLHINGLFLYIVRNNKDILLTSVGKAKEISLSIPLPLSQNKVYKIVMYLSKPLTEEQYEMLYEVISAFTSKLEDIDKTITDPLTGAYNRAFLEEYLDLKLNHDSLAVLMLDLDHFKEVNDTLGHEAGDMVLKEVVKRIEKSVRDDDVIIRMGGDEFLIIMKNTYYNVMCRVAERIRENIKNPPIVEEIPVSASIGAVYKPENIESDIETLIKMADNAMYKAKESRNAITCIELGKN